MEDIIEEIVGEIHDEYDDEERTYVVLNDHTWIFEAKTQLTDFYKIAKVDEDEFERVVGDADTLAGMLLEIKGEFPALHEKVTYHNYEFEVLEMDSRRILKVKFTILPKEEWKGEGRQKSKMGLFLQDKTNDGNGLSGRWRNHWRHCWLFYLMRAGSVVNRNFCNLLPNGER